MVETTERKLFTIGHSNHSTERFLKLLSDNGIQVLVDVRSHPYSKFASQFNGPSLKKVIAKVGVRYLYLGRELGGKPENPLFYDKDGHASYFQMAKSPDFLKAVARLLHGLEKFNVVIMCSEEDPTECHRRLLISRVLARQGVRILHIRSDGLVQTEEELFKATLIGHLVEELPNFGGRKEDIWRSVKPIRLASQSETHRTSSRPSEKRE